MTRNEWEQAFADYMANMTGIALPDAQREASASADYQVGQYGDEPAYWQGPEAAAHEAITEWAVSTFGPGPDDPESQDDDTLPSLDELQSMPRGNLPDSLIDDDPVSP